MTDYLLFRLYGPLAAWGDVAVGELRPTTAHPSKSTVLGLVAAALGIRRHEEDRHQQLEAACGFAVLVENAGVHLRDYHTVQQADTIARLKHLHTRRDELADRGNRYTIISRRDYRADALCTVALWIRSAPVPATLEQLAEALRRPRLPLYLGRKSCPLSLPLAPRIVPAATLDAAFSTWLDGDNPQQAALLAAIRLDRLSRERECYWEAEGSAVDPQKLPILHTTARRDRPVSRQRRQFAERAEHYGRLKGG